MKNIIILGLIFNIAFANISKEQLNEYLKVSVGGAFFSTIHFNLLVKFAQKGLDKSALKKIANDEKYVRLYAYKFMKFSKNEYIELTKFYKSEVGKKYVKSIYDISKIDKNNYQELYLQTKCTEEKKAIIEQINKKLNILNLKLEFSKKYFSEINAHRPKNFQKSIYEIEINELNYKEKLIQHEKILSCLQYKNFTVEELSKINDYASTKIFKEEIQLIYEGLGKYIKVLFEDIEEPLAKYYKEIQSIPRL